MSLPKLIVKLDDDGLDILAGDDIVAGTYVLDKSEENTVDVLRFYYGHVISSLVKYATDNNVKVDNETFTKEHADAYLVRRILNSELGNESDKFRIPITKRDLNREELIMFVNTACCIAEQVTGKKIQLFEEKNNE